MEATYQKIFFAILISVIIIEMIWSVITKRNNYNTKDALANFSIVIIGRLLKPLSIGWAMLLFGWIEPYKVFNIPKGSLTFIGTFLVVEFAYYWYHRLSHELPLLWTIHHTHHSSKWFNFTVAGRLNWIGKFISILFFLPLILLGFPSEYVTGSLILGLFYQFFLHTEAIGRLGKFEGFFFNTPSAHRVHHGSNKKYLDKNYGGMLIIFDRLFGTYISECEEVKYGVTTGFLSYNPFTIVFKPLIEYTTNITSRKKQRESQQKQSTIL